MLNPDRPSNPFTATTEPDWKTTAMGSARSTAQPNIKASTAPRKPPQPFDGTQAPQPSANLSSRRMPVGEIRSRNSSQASTTSTSSNLPRKPAPPIPKKPSSLTRSSGRLASDEGDQSGPPLPPRRRRSVAPSGLMDDDDEVAASIPSLRPERKR